jgi:mono/diheme cytochrome c family protein
MTMRDKLRVAVWCAAAATLAAACAGAAQPQITTAYSGEALYLTNCSTCHGKYGEGNGPMAADLGKTPPDLRHLAAANGGVFPRQRVTQIIDGRVIVAAHGDREMPVWGQAFSALNEDETKSPAQIEADTQARIAALVNFLIKIQQK